VFDNKSILVTGGTGMIGQQLVKLLLVRGANIRIVSLDDPSRAHPDTEFLSLDLRYFDQCLEACEGVDMVFNLAGIKGSPAMSARKPASFFVPTLQFSINMMEAARRQGVEKYLFTSSVGVYSPTEIFYEDDMWKRPPSENDRFAGWAKRMGELQAEAYKIEHGWEDVYIVRPGNVFGPWDNFDSKNAMVIPSLIRRVVDGDNPLVVWGDGSELRDFIHARDCARGMIEVVESELRQPVNLASGKGVSIREIVEIIAGMVSPVPELIWDVEKPSGDKKRILSTERAKSIGFCPRISLADGIRETMEWYESNRDIADNRYNSFTESK